MSVFRQDLALGARKGVPFYGVNPSIPARGEVATRRRPKQIATGTQAMIIHPGTSEVLGRASVAFMEAQEVDPQRFVKLYVDGVQGLTGLSKAGSKVLELIIGQLHAKSGQDQVALSAFYAKEAGIEARTYQRGLRDLLDKEILFATPAEGLFFINIQYIFNGDRLHFIKSFYARPAKELASDPQRSLGFGTEVGAER